MDRKKKSALVAKLSKAFAESDLVVITKPTALTVSEMQDLRGKLREQGAGFMVTKNKLARLALKDTAFEGLADYFTGPTAIAFSSDPIAAAKAAYDFSKENDKLALVAGSQAGVVFDAQGVETLAKLPSLDQLRGKLVGLLQAPAGKIVGTVQAPARQLAQVTAAYASKEG